MYGACNSHLSTVKLSYNAMKETENFLSLQMSVGTKEYGYG